MPLRDWELYGEAMSIYAAHVKGWLVQFTEHDVDLVLSICAVAKVYESELADDIKQVALQEFMIQHYAASADQLLEE